MAFGQKSKAWNSKAKLLLKYFDTKTLFTAVKTQQTGRFPKLKLKLNHLMKFTNFKPKFGRKLKFFDGPFSYEAEKMKIN